MNGKAFHFGAFDASTALRQQQQTGVGDAYDLALDIAFNELIQHAEGLLEFGGSFHHSFHFNDATVPVGDPVHEGSASSQVKQR